MRVEPAINNFAGNGWDSGSFLKYFCACKVFSKGQLVRSKKLVLDEYVYIVCPVELCMYIYTQFFNFLVVTF